MLCLACASVIVAVGIASGATQPASETVLHSFATPPNGATPYATLISDAAGNFFGTTNQGGSANAGVVFKVDTAGHQTVLYSFTGGADGLYPYSGVVGDSAGNLYGTTYRGGTAGVGVVYKLDTARHLTVLYTFTGGSDGGYPLAGVIRDAAGNLYGTASQGGASSDGVVYRLDTAGHETVLHSFTGGARGFFPSAGVTRDAAGNLYGTTPNGGTKNAGLVYKLDAAGHLTVLYNFTGGADGGGPVAGVIRDSAGNLYGTTSFGAANPGVVYKLDTTGQLTVLYSFTGGADGGSPDTAVIRDSAGSLYGTTPYGGAANEGVVYKLDSTGHHTVLYSFTGGADGGRPQAGLMPDGKGNLYGTTLEGGTANLGGVFKVAGAGQEMMLYSFPGSAGGSGPTARLVHDSEGNLYGTTSSGGAANAGVVYKLDKTGQQQVLYSFTGGADGGAPYAGVIRDSEGNLYGTTLKGGTAGAGVVYKVDAAGHETVLYTFTGGTDGSYPQAGLIRDSAGNLYGTTVDGGISGLGVVFMLDTAGLETVLYSFTGGADGGYPYAGVIRDSAGNLYGTALSGGALGRGVVYKLDMAGHETVLYSFTGAADGGQPEAGVISDSAGNLYGTTAYGGAASAGVVYKLDAAGHETVLYTFTGGADGSQPFAGVIRDSEGNLYGTTTAGGTGSAGVVYKLDPAGNETVLYNFTGGTDGGVPQASVIRDAAGNLYGSAVSGGRKSGGVVFQVKLTP